MNIIPPEELLIGITDKIFIVSLPRTGTKSLSKMLMTMGYKIAHCPSIRLEANLNNNEFEAYADTPIYCPSIFSKLVVQPSNKFIYVDRDVNSWLDSFERTKLHRSYLDYTSRDYESMHRISKLDRNCYIEVFGHQRWDDDVRAYTDYIWDSDIAKEKFKIHKLMVESIIPQNQLLIYKFEQGWNVLCDFLGKEIPNSEIPHINKNTLFEKIV